MAAGISLAGISPDLRWIGFSYLLIGLGFGDRHSTESLPNACDDRSTGSLSVRVSTQPEELHNRRRGAHSRCYKGVTFATDGGGPANCVDRSEKLSGRTIIVV
jgi:hypothetical protein